MADGIRKGNLNKQVTLCENKSTGQERIKNSLERKQKEQESCMDPMADRSGGGTDGWRERGFKVSSGGQEGGTAYLNQMSPTLFSKSHSFAQK